MIKTITSRKGIKANKIKGTALEFMVAEKIKEPKDCSIRKLLEKYEKEQKYFYVFKKTYAYRKSNGTEIKYFKNTILSQDEFDKYLFNFISYKVFEEYIIKMDFSSKRVDLIYQIEDKVYLIECKNKEKTYFGSKDVYTTMIYPKILYKSGIYIKELDFIYNGKIRNISQDLIETFNRYGKTHINFKDAEIFLRSIYKNKLKGCFYNCDTHKYKLILSEFEHYGDIEIIIVEKLD